MDQSTAAYGRPGGALAISGGIVLAIINVVLPSEDEDVDHFVRVARSNSWPYLHLGLILGVFVTVAGLWLIARALGPRSVWHDFTAMGLASGGTLMVLGAAVAGVAVRKQADEWLVAVPEHNVATFFSAMTADHIAYAIFGVALLVLVGLVPILIAVLMLRTDRPLRALAAGGVVVGALGVVAGLVQLTAELDTSLIATAGPAAVLLWIIITGAVMLRRAPAE